jgi:hypothetical protein
MGAGTNFRHPMAWQATLGGMQANGTLAYQVCSKCKLRRDVDVAALVEKEGPRSTLWDRRPICPRCGERTHYMASPGPGTPFRPMLSGMLYDEARRQFFRALGLTRRDVTRIRAMAEATVPGQLPRELADLDVPIRVTARCRGEPEPRGAEWLGEWADRVLFFWRMNAMEAEVWERKRRAGPKLVPSTPRRRRT